MELKDQILQTKERKKGFLKAMSEETRTQVDAYTKLDKISGKYWLLIISAVVLALITYLIACLTGGQSSRWMLNLIPVLLLIGGSVITALYIKSLANKSKKAIRLGASDYIEELSSINARLAGLEKAEKARVEAEKQEARAKARAEAAQRDAELALQKQQAAMQHVTETAQPAAEAAVQEAEAVAEQVFEPAPQVEQE